MSPASSARPAPAGPTPGPARSTFVSLGAARHWRKRARMEIRLHALALLVQRVDLVAAPVFLDAPHLPAFFLQQRGELLFGLPALAAARVAGGKAGGLRVDREKCR